MILAKGAFIVPEDLPLELRNDTLDSEIAASDQKKVDDNGLLPLADIERSYILRVLQARGGNKSATARILGISRSTLREKLNRYRITS